MSFLTGAAAGAAVTIVISAVDKFSTVFAGVNKGLLVVGAGITALGVAGLAASKGFINTAASFETAFVGVKKTVELTESEFERLRQTFKDLSKEIPVSFEELSSIGEIAGQLGVEGVDNIEKFTKTIAGISVTTNLTAEEAATSFARIANIMQEPIENVDKMASVVVELGNNFATTEGEIVTFAQRIAGAGNIAGLATSDILAIGAAFSSVGVQAEAGGTATQKVLIQMNTAVVTGAMSMEDLAEETGLAGDELTIEFERMRSDLTKFAETAGMSADEFAKAWRDDAGKAFGAFIIGLGAQGDDAIKTLDALDLQDQRLIRSFLSLANAGDLITDTLKSATDETITNTAAVIEAEKRYASTDSQVTILQNKFSSLKDDMGRALIPAFISLVDILGKVIGWLEEHPTLTKYAVATLAIGSALMVVLGPIIMLIALLPLLATGIGMIGAAFTAASLPIIAVVALVAGLIASLIVLGAIIKEIWSRWKGEEAQTKEEAIDEFNRTNPDVISSSSSGSSNENTDSTWTDAQKKKWEDAIGQISNSPTRLSDFILTPSGKIIEPSPQDTIIGTKNPENLGGGINVNIENVYGLDAEQISESIAQEIKRTIRL